MLAVAFVSVYITMSVHIHTQGGRQFRFFNVQKIFEQLIISEQCSTGEPEVSTESDGNAQEKEHGKVLEELAGQRCSALTPLLWVE